MPEMALFTGLSGGLRKKANIPLDRYAEPVGDQPAARMSDQFFLWGAFSLAEPKQGSTRRAEFIILSSLTS